MGLAHPFHDFDNEAFAKLAVKKLVARGRRHLALLAPPPALTYSKHTHLGFEHGLRQHGLTGVPLTSIDVDTPLLRVREASRQLAAGHHRPDGIVCSALRTSFAVVAGLESAGLVIGSDFDIVTKHSTELQQILRPEIIAIPEDFHRAGFDAARMVMAWLNGADPTGLQHLEAPQDT